MLASVYGRQWNNTTPEYAFRKNLLHADLACMNNNPQEALRLYKKESRTNPIARRRLNIANKQNRRILNNNGGIMDDNLIKLGFIDWYHGYERDIQPLIASLFRKAEITIELSDVIDADILVAGGYKQELINNDCLSTDKLVLFVSGENISPAYNYHDCSMTTRHSSFYGKNIRLPQWYGEIKFGSMDFNETTNKLPREPRSRDLLFTAIYNNSTPEREAIIATLRNTFGANSIHVYGSQRGKNIDKMDILSNSVVNICFENSIGDGYTTEKLFHSKMMGCKSLYWGDGSYELDFTSKDVHNVKTASCLEETIKWCERSIASSGYYQFRGSKIPDEIFTRRPSIKKILVFMRSWANIVLCWRGYN